MNSDHCWRTSGGFQGSPSPNDTSQRVSYVPAEISKISCDKNLADVWDLSHLSPASFLWSERWYRRWVLLGFRSNTSFPCPILPSAYDIPSKSPSVSGVHKINSLPHEVLTHGLGVSETATRKLGQYSISIMVSYLATSYPAKTWVQRMGLWQWLVG